MQGKEHLDSRAHVIPWRVLQAPSLAHAHMMFLLFSNSSSLSSLAESKLHNLCLSFLACKRDLFDDSMKKKLYVLITMPHICVKAANTCWLLLLF